MTSQGVMGVAVVLSSTELLEGPEDLLMCCRGVGQQATDPERVGRGRGED